jgi:regulator of protease activity HflC (stomatin/prohibitin superfamily)
VNTIIRPQLSEAVQSVIGQFKPQDIYSSSTGATANRLFEDAKRIIGGVYVDVEDIALFNIKLPQRVQEAIQSKAEEEQKAEAYQFKVLQEQAEFRRKQIEVSGLELYAQMAGQIPNGVLVLKGIEATSELAKSPNAKILLFGNQGSLPLLLGNVPEVQK